MTKVSIMYSSVRNNLGINHLSYSCQFFSIIHINCFKASKSRRTSSQRGGAYFLTKEDYANGAKIDEDNEIPKDQDPVADAIEDGYGFQGDMDLTADQAAILENGNEKDSIASRSALTSKTWPMKGSNVFIPYVISGEYDADERANIARAFEDFENNTCLR